jgi:hypothetical protein
VMDSGQNVTLDFQVNMGKLAEPDAQNFAEYPGQRTLLHLLNFTKTPVISVHNYLKGLYIF